VRRGETILKGQTPNCKGFSLHRRPDLIGTASSFLGCPSTKVNLDLRTGSTITIKISPAYAGEIFLLGNRGGGR
jgi:hypothetical protein